MSARPSSVVSSSGWRCGIASARQCTQASAHARVTSQMTMNGAEANGVSLGVVAVRGDRCVACAGAAIVGA